MNTTERIEDRRTATGPAPAGLVDTAAVPTEAVGHLGSEILDAEIAAAEPALDDAAAHDTAAHDIGGAPTSLWRNWRFQALWIGSSTSLLGINAAEFAYPLVILLMTRSPALAAVFGFVQMAATTLAGLPAGVLVDRWDRRHVLMGAEALRAITTASVFAAWAFGHLTLAHLFVVAALLGAVTPLGGSARMLMVRAVVSPEQLTRALTQDEVRTAAAGLGGPPLGGVLLAASRGLPFVFTTVTFVISFVTALIVRVPGGSAAQSSAAARSSAAATGTTPAGDQTDEHTETKPHDSMFAGIRALWHDRTMRAALAMFSLVNVGG
ncbi:MAG TPA: MFS transporter, partial [Micromonosporaceae bacterium]